MTQTLFVQHVKSLNRSDECSECRSPVGEGGTCYKCGNESEPSSPEHLAEVLDGLIDMAREVE